MTDNKFELSPNDIARYLGKAPEDFTLEDIIDFVTARGVKMINFLYPAQDGRVKTLTFYINSREYLETILTQGERVDGSSLFPAFVEPGSSDLYVVPRYRTAFMDPFCEIPSVSMLCSFYDKDGQPFECDPHRSVLKAAEVFKSRTGMTFEAMGELEYYVIAEEDKLFPGTDQKGYHESGPFAKLGFFRAECMDYIARSGGIMKYGHSEVGSFTREGKTYEQNEIEFLPCPVESAADQILLAKWVIRNLALRHRLDVTFAPKIIVGEAGSGMHIHIRIMKDGRNMMVAGGKLSDIARRAIAGMLELAPAITAFGNKNPTSYFRLVPHQEAPTNICWGDCNRSTLVRVPLGWISGMDMCGDANPAERMRKGRIIPDTSGKQTVEMRSPDSSADIYQLMAGLCTACLYGLEMPEEKALGIAEANYAGLDIHKEDTSGRFAALPACCWDSAECLAAMREIFEKDGIFPPRMTDGIIASLKAFNDKGMLSEAVKDNDKVADLVKKFYYCG
ncbi:MAG: glutamine synthetase family protein [Candidatus Cryptobacteroides sp.]